MKLDKQTKILIIGLGVMGGSYAKALSDKGYSVKCITKEAADIRYGMEKGMICYGTAEVEPEIVSEAELIIFAIYPKTFIEWIEKYQHLISPGTVITDVTGVKSEVVYKIQEILRDDVEYIPAHPMAGRERSGVEYADPAVFQGANYIVTPTEKNSLEAIKMCKSLGEELGFLRISELSPESHDEMIAFLSQLTHIIGGICGIIVRFQNQVYLAKQKKILVQNKELERLSRAKNSFFAGGILAEISNNDNKGIIFHGNCVPVSIFEFG